jgi:hypothetical protein
LTTLLPWLCLVILSAALSVLLELPRFPAALLIGPMAAAIVLALCAVRIRIPAGAMVLSQGVLGLIIGAGFPPGFLGDMALHWPLIVGCSCMTILISTALGWLLMRSAALPGTTALWGFSAGAATVMTFMSQSYGADFRLVAFMQYLRVVCVAMSAGIVVRFGMGVEVAPMFVDWFPPVSWPSYAAIALIAGGLSLLGERLPLAGGALLLPMLAGAMLAQGTEVVLMPTPWLKALSFAVIGWAIGLRFTPELIRHAARAFPVVAAATLAMIVANGVVAVLLARGAGIDLLTAFLATSPGGADSVAIIAATVPVDLAFVATMQTARFLMVLAFSPAIARRLSGPPVA